MRTVTIRKFVVCSVVISVCLVLNALIHQSVFTSSFFCNSTLQHKSFPDSANGNSDRDWQYTEESSSYIAFKPFENTQNEKNVTEQKSEQKSCSISEALSGTVESKIVPENEKKNFSNFSESESQQSLNSSNISRNQNKIKPDVVRNAPWPFSSTIQTKVPVESENEIYKGRSSDSSPFSAPEVLVTSRNCTHELKEEVLSTVQESPENRISTSDSATVTSAESMERKISESTPRLPEGYIKAVPAPEMPPEERTEDSHEGSKTALPPAPELKVQAFPEVQPREIEMRPFPVVEEPVEESDGPLEEPFIDPTLGDSLAGVVAEPEASDFSDGNNEMKYEGTMNEKEESKIPVTGNFPMTLGDPVPAMEAETESRFGVMKPVVLPDIPESGEEEDVMVIEGVSDLDSSR